MASEAVETPNEIDYESQDQEHLDDSGSDDCVADIVPAGALSSKFDKTDTSINTNPLPAGKYTLIGIDIDTTGRRLIDEIVQISAYTPEHQYSQYIMPLMNLNPAARQRHQVRVITVGFFRMLKSMQTYRVVKTKTEVAALNEFISWLEERHQADEGSDGVVLIYHEQRKFVPYMVIEALKKYNLLERFTRTVKSFANGFKLAEDKCSKTIKYLSIRQLSKLVLDDSENKDGFEGNAAYRARLAYQIARKLCNDENGGKVSLQLATDNEADSCKEEIEENGSVENVDSRNKSCSNVHEDEEGEVCGTETTATEAEEVTGIAEKGEAEVELDEEQHNLETEVDEVTGHVTIIPALQPRSRPTTETERERMCTVLCELASPIISEISELAEQEKILLRQNSLRPVFLQYFKTTIYHRVKAVTYRRVLAEYGYDFESLYQLWTQSAREGLADIIAKITELKDDERTELIELLDCHYDPNKQQLKPVVKRVRRRTSRGRLFFANKNSNSSNGNYNNNMKDNRNNKSSLGGRSGNQQPSQQQQQQQGNNTYFANNNHIQKNYNNNQVSGSTSPNGGGRKFRQRQSVRRRRSSNNQNLNDNNNNSSQKNFNQPQVIEASA